MAHGISMNNRRQNALWETAFSLVPLSYYKDDATHLPHRHRQTLRPTVSTKFVAS